MRDLLSDYQARRPELMAFYGPTPEQALADGNLRPTWPASLVEAVNAYQERLGARNRVAGNEIAVVTGQQPGLLAGPLYTIYKAITAIKLARRIEASTGAPCVPIFWIADDDHDFAETGHVHLLTKFHEPLRLDYAPEGDVAAMPMHAVPLEPSLHKVVDNAADHAFCSELAPGVRRFLHESLDASSSYGEWTGRLLAALFADTPLTFFTPHLPAARMLARPILEASVRAPSMAAEALAESGARLRALDYPQQVAKRLDECAFFLERDKRRRKVVFRRGRFVLPETHETFRQDEMLALLEKQPEAFSPNVALRCAVQQQLFPAAAYVAGPGELAYWAQLKPLFAALKLRPPAVYPRARCVLLTEKTRELLGELGLSVAEAHQSVEILAQRGLRRTADSPALDVVRARRGAIEERAQALAAGLADADAPVQAMAEKLTRGVAARLDHLEWVIARGDHARREAVRERVVRVANWVAPWRKPQERVYTVFSFLFEHGWPLIGRIEESLDIDAATLQEVTL